MTVIGVPEGYLDDVEMPTYDIEGAEPVSPDVGTAEVVGVGEDR